MKRNKRINANKQRIQAGTSHSKRSPVRKQKYITDINPLDINFSDRAENHGKQAGPQCLQST